MKKILGKNLIVFLSLVFFSCSAQDGQQPKIRIVDLQGKSHPVVTRFPDLNAQALASQGKLQGEFQNKLPEEQNSSKNSPSRVAVVAQQNLAPNPVSDPVAPTIVQNAAQPSEQSGVVVDAGVSKEKTVEYDLAESEASEKPAKAEPISKQIVEKTSSANAKKFFVQVGSFSNGENASKTLASMRKFHQGKIEIIEGDKAIHRVLLGPFSNRKKSKEMVKKIASSGHEAILVRSK
jgi:cell division protein FtsN